MNSIEKILQEAAKSTFWQALHFWVGIFRHLEVAGFETKHRGGGVFAAFHEPLGGVLRPLIISPVGVIPPEKIDLYYWIASVSKPGMLVNNPMHCLSWQSRTDDPNDGKWGGAIRVPMLDAEGSIILSFSGLTEAGDFTVSAMAAIWLGLINQDEALIMAQLCGAETMLRHYLEKCRH